MIFSFLFYVFLAYLLYRLVFNFIIPLYRTTRQVKKSFRNMQDQMRQHSEPQGPQPKNSEYKSSPKGKAGDYIDFEEIKD